MNCPVCGAENPENAVFCMMCGGKISEPGRTPPPTGEADEPSTATEQEATAPVKEEGEGTAEETLKVSKQTISIAPVQEGVIPPSTQPTIAMEPVSPEPTITTRAFPTAETTPPRLPAEEKQVEEEEGKAVCPHCYAENPLQNLYCQECGSKLPSIVTGATRPVSAFYPPETAVRSIPTAPSPPSAPSAPQPYPTPAQPTSIYPAVAGRPASALPSRKAEARRLGPADVLAILSLLALGVAISPLFKWSRGNDLTIFSFQGVNRPGGPGILPYAGWEWLTVGVIASVAIALAFAFLLVRHGRGPIFILSGWIALFPFIYLAFQSLLPLRAQGVEFEKAVGFSELFFGGGSSQNITLEPTVWLLVGAGFLLLVAGFLAPPRGWGRLATFTLFGMLIVGLAFFCAMAYNWNLFIPEPVKLIARSPG